MARYTNEMRERAVRMVAEVRSEHPHETAALRHVSGLLGMNVETLRLLSTTVENEAIATVENEATQTDWMGDLSGGLGFDPAAGCGRCSAAAGRSGSGYR